MGGGVKPFEVIMREKRERQQMELAAKGVEEPEKPETPKKRRISKWNDDSEDEEDGRRSSSGGIAATGVAELVTDAPPSAASHASSSEAPGPSSPADTTVLENADIAPPEETHVPPMASEPRNSTHTSAAASPLAQQCSTPTKEVSPLIEAAAEDTGTNGSVTQQEDVNGGSGRPDNGDVGKSNADADAHVSENGDGPAEAPDNRDNDDASEPKAAPAPTPSEPTLYFPAVSGCRSVDAFTKLNKIEEGTYGVVYRVRDNTTKKTMALKRLKMEKEKHGFPITALREVNTLLKCKHENIVNVQEIVVGANMDLIFIAMEFVEHDLKTLLETMTQPFLQAEVKIVLLQLLRGVNHLHQNWILHRDLKTSNLLMSHRGILKIADFGLAREYGSPLMNYTQLVVTMWYRPPELFLGAKEYSTAVDMWSVGCIFAEILTQKALLPGKSEIEQLNKIFMLLGTPDETVWPGFSDLPMCKKIKFKQYPPGNLRQDFRYLTAEGFKLLSDMLCYDPKQRISAADGIESEYFTESPRPCKPDMLPYWPAKSEGEHKHKSKQASPPAPAPGANDTPDDSPQGAEDDDTGYQMVAEPAGATYQGAPGFQIRF
eukprot:m.363921 g.363921  ORF g.363921 m.363921 type:complete len:602 (-) comp20807_c0_seq1:127-1932(-)